MIHYHGTPLSGDQATAIRALRGRHAMVSAADTKQLEIAAEVCQSFSFDNGAFTAWKTGQSYDIEKYAALIGDWHRHPGIDWYVIPDDIGGDCDANERMRELWLNLVGFEIYALGVPVWHMHEPVEVLRDMCHDYSRVAIGSSGQYAVVGNSLWWQRMGQAMAVACDDVGRPIAKLHGLRMLDPTVFSHLPLSSADSTNVARNIGIDSKWRGTYTPKTNEARAQILMERIELHGAAARWNGDSAGVQQNLELFG